MSDWLEKAIDTLRGYPGVANLMSEVRKNILGISFDGLATSGIVNELLNVAAVLRNDASRVLVDVGRDIRMRNSMDFESAFTPQSGGLSW